MVTVMPDKATCWSALATRDRAADGRFVYAVRTTGIYCRPSCGARRPRAENVEFYPTCEAAERSGFRPCRRCRPNGRSRQEEDTQAVVAACRLIEKAESLPGLAELASAVGSSRYPFHRLFKSVSGLTPRDYALAHRAKALRELLPVADTVTATIHESGVNSNGRLCATAPRSLGMVPTHVRQGGSQIRIRFAAGECSLGSILVGATEKGICAILLGDDPNALMRDLQGRFPHADLLRGDADFDKTVAAVVGLVEQPKIGLDLPLDIRGTAFQQRVWQALREIGVGHTGTYAEIAATIGQPKAMRAVARACAANPLAIAIPCHRIVRTDGDLSGYPVGCGTQARTSEARDGSMTAGCITGHDWSATTDHLDDKGWARIRGLVPDTTCDDIAGAYDQDTNFRTRIVMSRHGFGRGEYKYFSYPLPDIIQTLRSELYRRLEPVANAWNEQLGSAVRYPDEHTDFLARCHEAGQRRPTPLLLRYGAGDYNCLHQDLYGENVFPLQVAILLSEPGQDFEGGEFVLTEQRPRAQSRAIVVPLKKGDGVVFAVSHRPVRGTRGIYRVNLRHGVSEVRTGRRHTLGIIFHDGA